MDSLFIPAQYPQESDPDSPPSGSTSGKAALLEEITKSETGVEGWWGFRLVLAYPRRSIAWEQAKRLGEVDALKGGGQVVVEMVSSVQLEGETGSSKDATAANGADSDGYATEESE